MTQFTDTNRSPILKPLYGVVSNVVATGVAVARVPPGATMAALCFQFTIAGAAATRTQLETMCTQVRFSVSGVEMWTVSMKQLIAILEFYRTGLIADTGFVTIPFERLWMQSTQAQLDPDYGTLGESSMQLEFTMAASTIDTINAFGVIHPVSEALGAHVIMRRFMPNVGAIGKYLYPDLPIIPGEYLYALHFELPVVANLNNIALITDEVRAIDFPPAWMNQLYNECVPVRTPQTAKGYAHAEFTRRGFDSDSLPVGLCKSLVLELNFINAAPGQITIIGEYATTSPTNK